MDKTNFNVTRLRRLENWKEIGWMRWVPTMAINTWQTSWFDLYDYLLEIVSQNLLKGRWHFLFYYNDGLCTICIWVKLKGEIIRRNEKLSLNFSIYATNTKSVFWTQNPHIIILSSLWLYCDSNLFLTIDVLLILERIRWHPFFFFQVIPLNIFPSHIFYRVIQIAKLALNHYDKTYISFVFIQNKLLTRVTSKLRYDTILISLLWKKWFNNHWTTQFYDLSFSCVYMTFSMTAYIYFQIKGIKIL